jgi:thiamine-phosphate pyrophosphorylase
MLNEADRLENMFDLGLEIFHLRKPAFSENDLRNYLKRIPTQYINKVVIHDHYKLAEEFDLKGIHWGEKVRRSKVKSNEIKKKYSVSTSFHDLGELEKCNDNFEYIFYSPVFSSISKKDYKPKESLSVVGDQLHGIQHRVIGLGGITPQNIHQLKKIGFYGAATLGYVWQSEDPVNAFREIKTAADSI